MSAGVAESLPPILTQLIRLTQAWALRRPVDWQLLQELRTRAVLANHAYYYQHIPAYQNLANQAGINAPADIAQVRQHLMLPDEIFKSYNQHWLDERNFNQMNAWLSEIFHRRVEVDLAGVTSLDGWIERLDQHGIRLVYSSGTSGSFSFIPRDEANWAWFRMASTCYLASLLMYQKVGAWWQRLGVRLASRWLAPQQFAALAGSQGAADYDAFFLDFSGGRTGNQMLARELSPLFRRHVFLYEAAFSPSVVRLVVRGARTEEEQAQVTRLQALVVDKKEENYHRLIQQIRASCAVGQKVFIFGTPQLYSELCLLVQQDAVPIPLRPGSLLLFGGGWKTFTGERISRPELLSRMSNAFQLPAERILEGYSMTEINAFMLRCDFGRFHIPPYIEPVLYQPDLSVMEPQTGRGILGFLDPLALAYPGFIISGDEVVLVNGDCPCGLGGPAVTEISRASAREVKGCAGILTSVSA